MCFFSRGLGLAFALAALCLSGQTAHAQAAPVPYWIPGWPVGFSGDLANGQSWNTYRDFPGFDGGDSQADGFSFTRYKFPSGWFVGSERTSMGFGLNGIAQNAAFGNFGSIYTEGVEFGYGFKNASGVPFTITAGVDSLKYDTGIGNPFAPFSNTSGTLPGYGAHASVEVRPTSNLSLSLGVGYVRESGSTDSDINSSLLPGASPFGFGGR